MEPIIQVESDPDFTIQHWRQVAARARKANAATAQKITVHDIPFLIIPASLDVLMLSGRLPSYLAERIAGVIKTENPQAGSPEQQFTAALIAKDMIELGELHRLILENFVAYPRIVFEKRDHLADDEAFASEIPFETQTELVHAILTGWAGQAVPTKGGAVLAMSDLERFHDDGAGAQSISGTGLAGGAI